MRRRAASTAARSRRGTPRLPASCSTGRRRRFSSSRTRCRSRYLRDAAAGTSAAERMGWSSTRASSGSTREELERARRRARGLGRGARLLGHTEAMLQRVESFIREHDLIEPAARSPCLVSGGADSTCLWHVARRARLPRLGAARRARPARRRVGRGRALLPRACSAPRSWRRPGRPRPSCASCRYSFATERLRATGPHRLGPGRVGAARPRRLRLAAADQGAARGRGRAAAARRLARGDARLLRASTGSPYREDSSNPGTKRGLIRDEILPLLERLDPRARASLLSLADERPRLPRTLERTLAELLAGRDGTKAADLGARRPRRARVRHAPARGSGRVGAVDDRVGAPRARGARPPAGGSARRPAQESAGSARGREGAEAERDGWPLVVCGDEVVAVPGVAEAPGWEGAVTWRR